MIYVLYLLVALVGAGVHVWRHPGERDTEAVVETFLLWWIVVTIGVAGIVGALFHLLDGPAVAREIGFTRGDGGFQTEVGFADLAIGVLGVLCARFRDGFLLAAVIAVSISYLGDAYGHLHQAAIHDNHAPDNTGLTLWADFIAPLVAIAFYTLWQRAKVRE